MVSGDSGRRTRLAWYWPFLYLAFIIYGSLVPFEYRAVEWTAALERFRSIPVLDIGIGRRADLIANFVLYVPLGYLLAAATSTTPRLGVLRSAAILVLAGAAAIGIEFTQIFFAPRTVSANDLAAELLGTIAGLLVWRFGGPLLRLRQALVGHGPRAVRALLAAYALAYAALSFFPYDFLIAWQEVQWKLGTDRYDWLLAPGACAPAARCAGKLGAETLASVPLGILAALLLARRRAGLPTIAGLGLLTGAALEAGQFLLASGVTQGVSLLTRALGFVLGAAGVWYADRRGLERLERAPWRRPACITAGLAYAGLAAWLSWAGKGSFTGLRAGMERLAETRLLPFYYHYYTSEPVAMANLLYQSALYVPIGVLAWVFGLPASQFLKSASVTAAALIAAGLALLIESSKAFLTGAHPDPTNVLIAAGAAAAAALVPLQVARHLRAGAGAAGAVRTARTATYGAPRPATVTLTVLALAALTLAAAAARLRAPIETAADESRLPTFAHPRDLPPVELPAFRSVHPRLPHPDAADIETIGRENPRYFDLLRKRADGGKGRLDAAIRMAYVEPGSQDLDVLARRLLALEPSWRGHEQVKPLALGYDWLYSQWSPAQREALRAHTVAGCNFLIDYIREARLSPYNVILYNSPFQALVACALATWGDAPEADPVMRFTHDLWKERVLPVWRQVLGSTGGWHEGGEYVGIGIGQAVYQVPAMWRAATGEDLFAGNDGLRGLLDFLVYRRRPDGTDMRWGDAGFFNRAVPDRVALAIEYEHAPAYSLDGCPKHVQPSAWPWGPLPRKALCQPEAVRSLPLTRYFDGIGLLVARSDWSADATYVTFKAGDNYWSHSHLDQGAFTVYKGGALAIDSGLYGSRYGSDHHMNYTYQTIAHNVVTVRDPKDTVPAPGNDERPPRPIANDGGQRRIGSGWGVEPAPLDLREWQQKREIYHTATMLRVDRQDGRVIAEADLTPAYTNRLSGRGTFSHRTRRVERYTRTFAYDRDADAITIHDRLRITDADFEVRWLLHSLEKPELTADGFRITVPAGKRRRGGTLTARVLQPAGALIRIAGGPGREFEVDGVNYDDGGRVQARARRKRDVEPGAWRVEILPPAPTTEVEFHVVLVPRLLP